MHLKQKATVSIIQVYTGLFMVQTLSARNRHSLIFSGGILAKLFFLCVCVSALKDTVFMLTYRRIKL